MLPDIVILSRQVGGAQQEDLRAPCSNSSHVNGKLADSGGARAPAVLPTSTTRMPCGVRWRRAPATMRSMMASPRRAARSRVAGSARNSRGRRRISAAGDVGRIAHDDIVAPPREAVIDVGAPHAHAAAEAVAPDVAAGDREGARRDVGGIHAGARQRVRGRDRDTAGTGADVEHAADARRIDPGRETGAAQFRDRRARHEHVRRHADLVAGEPADAREVRRRQAFRDAPFDERVDAPRAARRHGQAVAAGRRFVREPERVEDECGRIVARIVGAVPVVQPRAREPRRSRGRAASPTSARSARRRAALLSSAAV